MAAYITVFDGSGLFYGRYPHLAMWATNIPPSSTVKAQTESLGHGKDLFEVKTMKKINRLGCLSILAAFAVSVAAQSGGTFVIEKSVIAGGGGQVGSGQFTLDGTVGESVAGTTSAGGTFELGSGFWGGGTTSSSNVTVSGRVLTSDGRGLRNATVSITDSNGVVRTTTTSSFGFFSFDNVGTGGTYTFRVTSRLYRFAPVTARVDGNLTLADFVGLE